MNQVKTAIVGCGKIAHLHAKGLLQSEYSDFKAVCTRSIEKARSFAAQYQVQPHDNLTKMITEESIDVLVVCTPHPNHAQPVIEAARQEQYQGDSC